ncbi:uncharacterized protein LY79DRAFT_59489 [Colletotrichum navitas]|uniref:Uncharacterized protein n=1 Tax=Colletotrichum navitas TaxID=681940 RepID=A0AAD8Q5J8_9PEZI|nr:uncharacterized protein LY79DRAFT_59489 [Colletotrichum navitas]KAK1596288.1 hypothetical protein LY79DRAFT_59489 [Colletotrichum navitas]
MAISPWMMPGPNIIAELALFPMSKVQSSWFLLQQTTRQESFGNSLHAAFILPTIHSVPQHVNWEKKQLRYTNSGNTEPKARLTRRPLVCVASLVAPQPHCSPPWSKRYPLLSLPQHSSRWLTASKQQIPFQYFPLEPCLHEVKLHAPALFF